MQMCELVSVTGQRMEGQRVVAHLPPWGRKAEMTAGVRSVLDVKYLLKTPYRSVATGRYTFLELMWACFGCLR